MTRKAYIKKVIVALKKAEKIKKTVKTVSISYMVKVLSEILKMEEAK